MKILFQILFVFRSSLAITYEELCIHLKREVVLNWYSISLIQFRFDVNVGEKLNALSSISIFQEFSIRFDCVLKELIMLCLTDARALPTLGLKHNQIYEKRKKKTNTDNSCRRWRWKERDEESEDRHRDGQYVG